MAKKPKNHSRIKVFGLIFMIVLVVIAIALFILTRPMTATGYQDAGGWVYKCSKPIKVKNQGVTDLNGHKNPTPIDISEAARYCQRIGIE